MTTDEELKNERHIQELKLKIKKYLELENVSVLTGAGTSFHLGAPIIRNISKCGTLKTELQSLITSYFDENADPSYEDLFNCIQADIFLKEKKNADVSELKESIFKMQKWLFSNCNTQNTDIHDSYKGDVQLKENKYFYHEMLIKKLLQRPTNLRRANLFTLNYDLAFDYALDNLGVHYINGFSGVHNRFFKPEVYDYDIYYPGQSVSGQVHRAEKVIRYFKLHGSLSWVATGETIANPYGIKEIPINDMPELKEGNQLMVFPCVSKKTFTLDLPYSELFRDFSKTIIQPQSVLITIGYSFNDEHVNDIIYQALSIPSFTLIIVNYAPEGSSFPEIEKLQKLNDKRIIVLDGKNIEETTFVNFVSKVMPDLYEEEDTIFIRKTMDALYSKDSTSEEKNGAE